MKSACFNQTTNHCNSGKYDEHKQVVDNELLKSKDSPNVITEKLLLEDKETKGNNNDSETDPKVSPHNVDEENNNEDNISGE